MIRSARPFMASHPSSTRFRAVCRRKSSMRSVTPSTRRAEGVGQDSVFGEQVVDNALLLAAEEVGDERVEELEGRDREHGGRHVVPSGNFSGWHGR